MAARPRKPSVALLKRRVSTMIQCAICLDTPTEPRCLPCLHTYCQSCLEAFYERSLQIKAFGKNEIKCPECQKVSSLPPGGILSLPTDFRVKQIEDIFNDVLNKYESDAVSGLSDPTTSNVSAVNNVGGATKTEKPKPEVKIALRKIERQHSKESNVSSPQSPSAVPPVNNPIYKNQNEARVVPTERPRVLSRHNSREADEVGHSAVTSTSSNAHTVNNPVYESICDFETATPRKINRQHSKESNVSSPQSPSAVPPVNNPIYKNQNEASVVPTERPRVLSRHNSRESDVVVAQPPHEPHPKPAVGNRTPETPAELALKLHALIEARPREARGLLHGLDPARRLKVVSHLVDGQSALSVAFQQNNYDLMIYITENCKADVNQIIIGHSADDREIESVLLIQAASDKDLTAAQVLVSHGAKVDQADGEGITPLFVACLEGSRRMVEYLVEVGADINSKRNKYGASPLMAAIISGHISIVKYLVDKGADVNTTQNDGYTPLMAACQKAPQPELMVALLLAYWADINLQDDLGRTPLMYAVKRQSLDTVAVLLMNGAHVNVTDHDRQTALHFAVAFRFLDGARELVKRGANPHVKNRRGRTCLDLAAGDPDMIAVLKKYKKIIKKK